MFSMPEQPTPEQQKIDPLLLAVENELRRIAKHKREAKRERRRLRRARRVLRGRTPARVAGNALCVVLLFVGAIAFAIGVRFLMTDTPGSLDAFEAAAAAWGLAAAIRPSTKRGGTGTSDDHR